MKKVSKSEYDSMSAIQKILYKLARFFTVIGLYFVMCWNGVGRSEYVTWSWGRKLVYTIFHFITSVAKVLVSIVKAIGKGIKSFGIGIKKLAVDIVSTFVNGDWKTRVSYLIMGFGNITRGQIARGVVFLVLEAVFIAYMVTTGAYWLGKFGTLGDVAPGEVYNAVLDTYVRVDGDDSFKILLYGLLTIIFIIAFIYAWILNIRQNKLAEETLGRNKNLPSFKDDIKSLFDENYHKTLLALPLVGITVFTVLPIIFMILVAFTDYDGSHDGYSNLFTWVGWDNFKELFNFSNDPTNNLGHAFSKILGWTLVWSLFATFTNYFLGMLVALLINKKGIKLKKMWRGILVLTIAIPQFVSLLYVSKLFAKNGLVNAFLVNHGFIDIPIEFWQNATYARILVIVINIWIGIPYLMLVATGILMNIPADLYESAKIDGASPWQQYTKITLPYMLFVTGPYLLTQFIGNMNNFNVIFLLTNGAAITDNDLTTSGGTATDLDLLVTWLFNITTGATSNYKLAAVIGIMIFIVVATISVIAYNAMPSNKNEEDFQ